MIGEEILNVRARKKLDGLVLRGDWMHRCKKGAQPGANPIKDILSLNDKFWSDFLFDALCDILFSKITVLVKLQGFELWSELERKYLLV